MEKIIQALSREWNDKTEFRQAVIVMIVITTISILTI